MIRIAAVVQSQRLYNKLSKFLGPPHFELTRNISTKHDLQEFVLGDEADVAIVDNMITWHQIALNIFSEYEIEVILFDGDFDQLEDHVRTKFNILDDQTTDQGKENVTPPDKKNESRRVPIKIVQQEASTEMNTPDLNKHDDYGLSAESERLQIELAEMRRKLSEVEQEKNQKLLELERQYKEEIVRLKNQPKPEPELVSIEGPERYKAIPQQFIVIGGLYRGVGSTFLALALAKVLDSMNIETLVMEFPKNEPYLYYRLGGQQKLPRNYAFYYPQMLSNQKASPVGQREEWLEGNITWMPADPSTGPLETWSNDHMRKSVYRAKQTITILDVGTSWLDPALEDVMAQAHHVLLVAGPDPSKLASRLGKSIVGKFKEEQLDVHMIANFVPDPVLPKTKDWFESLSFPVLCRFPCLSQNDIIKAAWDCQTIFDADEGMLNKAYNYFFPLIKEIVPANHIVEMKNKSSGFLARWFKK